MKAQPPIETLAIAPHELFTTSLAGALVAALGAYCLARLAPRLGWLDAATGPARARKLQSRPVPPVGGAAILLGLLLGAGAPVVRALSSEPAHAARAWGFEIVSAHLPGPIACALTLLGAFSLGLLDDLLPGGLRPRLKLLGQLAVGLPVALSLFDAGPLGPWLALAAPLCAVVALNAFNTFDNTDGGAGALGALALAGPMPLASAALVGFLPFNLDARRRPQGTAAVAPGSRPGPTCYLGDSGSHLLGALVLLVPAAWPALALPLFDLLRLSALRLARGSRPWIGDRRHLAHRLEAAGLSRAWVLGSLLTVAAPAVLLGGAGVRAGELLLLALGLAGTGVGFLLCVACTPDPDRVGGAS